MGTKYGIIAEGLSFDELTEKQKNEALKECAEMFDDVDRSEGIHTGNKITDEWVIQYAHNARYYLRRDYDESIYCHVEW